MRCTADPCHSVLRHFESLQTDDGDVNQEYGCSRRDACHGAREINCATEVIVRDGWYFLAKYQLPFSWIDTQHQRPDFFFTWYALVGSPELDRTELWGLVGRANDECEGHTLYSIPYVALPANDDLEAQFRILRDRMMHEWLGALPTPRIQTAPRTAFPFDIVGSVGPLRLADLPTISDVWAHGPHPIPTPAPVVASEKKPVAPSKSKSLIISVKLQELIMTANTDTIDDSAERAAMKVCRELKNQLI